MEDVVHYHHPQIVDGTYNIQNNIYVINHVKIYAYMLQIKIYIWVLP